MSCPKPCTRCGDRCGRFYCWRSVLATGLSVNLMWIVLLVGCGAMERHEFTAAELAEIDGELYHIDAECVEPVLCFDIAAKETCTYGDLVIVTCHWECVGHRGVVGDVAIEFRADDRGCWAVTQEEVVASERCHR